MRSILYTSAVNTNGGGPITYSDTGANGMKRWGTTVNAGLLHGQISPPSPQPFASRRCANTLPCPEPAANQDAPINKNSKSPNPRSLKQHTSAESIPLCFFSSVREIDRFIILICKHLPHRSRFSSKFSTRFSFSQLSHISSAFVFASSAFAFIFSRLSHLLWAFLFLS